MKKRLIISCINLLLLLVVGSSVVYAWYTNGLNTNKITITSASLATEITIYKGLDFNYDGNLDLVDGVEQFEELKDEHKTEKEPKHFKLIFNDIVPTEIHTWKFKVANLGDASGYFAIHLNQNIGDDDLKLVKYLCAIYDFNGKNEEKIYLGKVEPGDIIYGGYETEYVEFGKTIEFVVRFEFPLFKELVDAGVTNITEEEYNELQGTSTGEIYNFIEAILSSKVRDDQ